MAGVLSHQMSGGGEACLLALNGAAWHLLGHSDEMRSVICADSDISPRHCGHRPTPTKSVTA
jgi:hypothetical protein